MPSTSARTADDEEDDGGDDEEHVEDKESNALCAL
jgi:hypothetical protein